MSGRSKAKPAEAAAAGNASQAAGATSDGGQTMGLPLTDAVWAGIKEELAEREDYALRVIGPKKGRRRIGRKFGPDPVLIEAADLDEAQMGELIADASLKIDLIRKGDGGD